jgi:hypothetical protein
MKRNKKKKKKEHVSFERLKTFRRVFSAFFSIVVVFDVFTHIVVRSQTVSAALKDSTERLAYSKVIEEQMEHFVRLREVVKDCEKRVWAVDEFIAKIEDKTNLNSEEKKDLAIELKFIEENTFSLNHSFEEYFDDATVQYHPKANSNITNYFYETALLKLAMERFARRAEDHVLFSSLNASGKVIFLEDYYDVICQLDHLAEIEKNLKVFETLK